MKNLIDFPNVSKLTVSKNWNSWVTKFLLDRRRLAPRNYNHFEIFHRSKIKNASDELLGDSHITSTGCPTVRTTFICWFVIAHPLPIKVKTFFETFENELKSAADTVIDPETPVIVDTDASHIAASVTLPQNQWNSSPRQHRKVTDTKPCGDRPTLFPEL